MIPLIIFLVIFFVPLVATDIGSDTAVTRFNTSQIVRNGDRVAGFASLAAGFLFLNNLVTATWDCFFAVEGEVGLNFGTLILNEDLIFHNIAEISSLGNIIGQGHILELAPSMQCIPSSSAVFCTVSFVNSIATPANVLTVDWYVTGTAIAVGMANNAGNELNVYSWNGSSLALVTGVDLGQQANSVRWHPTQNWIAVARNSGGGNELFIYSFNGTTLTLLDSINLASNANSVAWHSSGGYLAVGSNVGGAELTVYTISGTGTFGASVSVNVTQDTNAVDWNFDGTYLVIGTQNGGGFNDVRVYAFDTGAFTLTLDASADTNANVDSISWNKTSPNQNVIAVGIDGSGDRLRIYSHTPGSLTQISTTLAIGTTVNAVHWNNGPCLAAGLNNNANTELNTYIFDGTTLLLQSGIEVGSTVLAVRWSVDGTYLADGVGALLSVYRADAAFVDRSNVTFSDVQIFLNNNLTLSDTAITFSGQNMINGQGNTLTLSPTFTLLVNQGGSLLLKDITVEGVNDAKIRGLDSRSTFSMQDVMFVLDGDFTFTQGRLDILKDFVISGPDRAFIYTSNEESTIRGGQFGADACSPIYYGALIIDQDTTFSYAPTNNSPNLLTLESELSKIILNSGNLVASTLNLTKGLLQVDGRSTLHGVTNITYGDGTETNNLCINIKPAANLEITGNLIHNDV